MPSPSAEEWMFEVEGTQARIEHEQRRARARFAQERRLAELQVRREVNGWAARNRLEDGTLSRTASMADLHSRVKARMDEMLQRISGAGEWPPKTGRPPDVSMLGGALATTEAVEAMAKRLGIEGPTAQEYLRSGRARAVWLDHKANPVGVRERETRQLTESAARLRAQGASMADVQSAAASWQINPGIFQLSTDAHNLAYARSMLGEVGDAMAKASGTGTRYAALVSEAKARTLNKAGRTAQVAFRSFDEDQLGTLYQGVNSGRRTYTSPRTLGLGHNTGEVYYPIPAEIADDVEALLRTRRRRFLEGAKPTVETRTRADVAARIREVRDALLADLALEGISPEEKAAIVGRLTRLLEDVAAGTV